MYGGLSITLPAGDNPFFIRSIRVQYAETILMP